MRPKPRACVMASAPIAAHGQPPGQPDRLGPAAPRRRTRRPGRVPAGGHQPRRSTGPTSSTASSPSTMCTRSWLAMVGSTWAATPEHGRRGVEPRAVVRRERQVLVRAEPDVAPSIDGLPWSMPRPSGRRRHDPLRPHRDDRAEHGQCLPEGGQPRISSRTACPSARSCPPGPRSPALWRSKVPVPPTRSRRRRPRRAAASRTSRPYRPSALPLPVVHHHQVALVAHDPADLEAAPAGRSASRPASAGAQPHRGGRRRHRSAPRIPAVRRRPSCPRSRRRP